MGLKLNKRDFLKIFLALFIILPDYYTIGGIMATRVFAMIFLVCWVIWDGKLKKVKADPSTLLVALMWGIVRIAVLLYHADISRAIVFAITFFGLGYVIITWVNTKERFLNIIDFLVGLSLIIGLLGIFEAITQINVFAIFNNTGAVLNYNGARFGMVRIISFTYQTINYCLFCAIMECFVCYRLSMAKEKRQKNFLKLCYFVLLFNMLLTLSRSILICFIVAQLIMWYRQGLVRFVKRVLLVVLAVFIVAVIWSFFTNSSNNLVLQIIYMLLAVFDNSFASKMASNWGAEDTDGIGFRVILYKWVWEKSQENLLFGVGERVSFVYEYEMNDGAYFWSTTKNQIEVNHLHLLYHYGIISTVLEAVMYFYTCIKGLVLSLKRRAVWESKLNFNFLIFVIFVMDIASWVAVNQGKEFTLLYVAMFLWVAYNGHHLYEEQN